MVVRLDRTQTGRSRSLNLGEVREFLFCFAFLASTPGVRLARTTIASTPRSVNDVCGAISNLLVDQGGLLPAT